MTPKDGTVTGNVIRCTPRTRAPETDQTDRDGGTVIGLGDRAVYTVKEVAGLLSLSLGGTYELVRDGTVPALKLGGRWVIPKKRFHAWLESCMVPAELPPGWA
jgi:excisionase family DNA binding protein